MSSTIGSGWNIKQNSTRGTTIIEDRTKYPIGGYAPGNYFCKCCTCENIFKGDKKAVQCETCATELLEEKED